MLLRVLQHLQYLLVYYTYKCHINQGIKVDLLLGKQYPLGELTSTSLIFLFYKIRKFEFSHLFHAVNLITRRVVEVKISKLVLEALVHTCCRQMVLDLHMKTMPSVRGFMYHHARCYVKIFNFLKAPCGHTDSKVSKNGRKIQTF